MNVWTCERGSDHLWVILDPYGVVVAERVVEDDAKRICELHRIFQEFVSDKGTSDIAIDLVEERLLAEAER